MPLFVLLLFRLRVRMFRLRRLPAVLGWMLAVVNVHAQDHITQRAWLEDPAGQLSWAQVQQLPVRTFDGVLSQGFGEGVIWVRLSIDPSAVPARKREPDRLILRVRPVYLDDIQVFDPLAQGLVIASGDRRHPRTEAFDGLDFMLPVARGGAPRDIWLRLQSTSTRQIAVQVLNYEDLQRYAQTQQLLFALYIGVILVFMVWGLVYWSFSRELLIGAFGLKQAAALGYAVISLGYARVYWPANWPAHWLDMSSSIFSCVAVSAAVFFHVMLIREFAPPAWIRRLFVGLLALLPLKLGLLMVSDRTTVLALQINMLEVLVTPLIFLISVILATAWKSPQPRQHPLLAKWVVVGFYGFLTFILLLAALPGLGLAGGGEIPLYLVQTHGLVTAFLILLMLQYRAHAQQKQQRETTLVLERAQLQAQQERSTRESQEKLLTMLAHELKTPLATMQMRLDASAQGSREIRQAIRDMNAVIERCVQTTQLDDQQLRASKAPIDLNHLIGEVVAACGQPERVQLQLPSQLTVQSDHQLLFIVLSNLLENACKYAAPDSPIQVHANSDAESLRLSISNAPGPSGWPEPDKIFDKYYRSPHARRQAGTGLGLYLVRNLVQILGGSIDYQPDAGQVRFLVTLPSTTDTD